MAIGKFYFNRLVVCCFVVGMFLQEVTIDSLIIFDLNGHYAGIIVSAIYIIYTYKIYKNQAIISLIIVCVSCLYFLLDFKIAIATIKFLIHIQPIFLIPFIIDSHAFSRIITTTTKIIIPFYIVLYYFGIGIDNAYSFPRMQGLLSEPSAIAFPATMLFVSSWHQKNYFLIIIALVAIYLADSLTVYIVPVLTIMVIYFHRADRVILLVMLFVISLLLFYMLDIFKYINEIYDNDNLKRMQESLIFIYSLGESGYSPRISSLFGAFYDLRDSGYWVFGRGLNSADYYQINKGAYNDFNIVFNIFYYFGIFGVLLLFILLIKVFLILRKNYDNNKHIIFLFSVMVSYLFINHAQGIVFSAVFYMLIIYVLVINLENTNTYNKKFRNT